MRIRPLLPALAGLLVCLLALAASGRRLARAEERAASAGARLDLARAQAAEIRDLRGRRERVESRERPKQDVIAQLNAALAEVGIRSDALTELEPLSDAAVARPGERTTAYRRQSVSATLEGLTARQIGAFLGEWRTSQPAWVPTRVELYHVKNQPEPALLYSARLVLTAVHVADEPALEQR